MSEDKKRILIATFSRNANYGGALQEFALYAYLKNKHDTVCLDYVNPVIRANSRVVRTAFFSAIGILVRSLFSRRTRKEKPKQQNKKPEKSNSLSFYIREGFNLLRVFFSDLRNLKTRRLQIHAYRQFWDNHITYTQPYKEKDLFASPPDGFDIYMAGSDQIWNPIKFGLSKVYFLCFAPSSVRKTSYAPSFANFHFSDDEHSRIIIKYLDDYSAISVRENHSQKELANAGITATHVLDPTFLLTKKDWINALGLASTQQKPYLLAYAMSDHAKVYEYAIKAGEILSFDVYIIGSPNRRLRNATYFPHAGPLEFVELFANASYVVTNSFHGTAFSVNFNIPFISLESNLPERIISLLNLTGLNSRIGSFKDGSMGAKVSDMNLDFSFANQILTQEQVRATEYLEKAINGE